jgi:hypothetical protein
LHFGGFPHVGVIDKFKTSPTPLEPDMHFDPLTPLEAEALARLHDNAVRSAHCLRAEAMDDFWRGAHALATSSFGGLGRSAERLRQRLARHRLQRLVRGL